MVMCAPVGVRVRRGGGMLINTPGSGSAQLPVLRAPSNEGQHMQVLGDKGRGVTWVSWPGVWAPSPVPLSVSLLLQSPLRQAGFSAGVLKDLCLCTFSPAVGTFAFCLNPLCLTSSWLPSRTTNPTQLIILTHALSPAGGLG